MIPAFVEVEEIRKALRKPFSPEEVSQLPSTAKRPALDYVSHAAVTNRLNEACPDWSYEITPVVVEGVEGSDGWPHVVAVFGAITVGGVTRQEVGAVDSPSTYGQEMKEAISDFIRRGAMRFGVALDLWSKQELPFEKSGAGLNASGSPASGVLPPESESPVPDATADLPGALAMARNAALGKYATPGGVEAAWLQRAGVPISFKDLDVAALKELVT